MRLDAVTGLRDSGALWKELAQRAASCSASSPLAVVVVDFDRLGEVNQRYDRSVGNAVLRKCAEAARNETASPRLAFRYRDDELVLLVPGDEEDGREVAERVRERIAAQNSTLPAVTVSCGVAVLQAPVEPMVALGKVGPALQAAKRSGGNRVVVATETDRNGRNGHNGDGGEGTACRAALAVAVASLEARDRATAAHSDDVVTLCESIGARLGLSDEQLDRLTAAAQLHDVGKLAMPTEILNKSGPLDDDEWAIIREHTVIGERMLRSVPEMGAVANMVRHSHESWDGSGYPDGLAGEEIPLASRIIMCADAFHAIRSDRPYRAGRSADEALKEVRSRAGQQFDPRVVSALVAVARDVRRAAGTNAALPRPRKLAALLAALALFGGGSAYAASEGVRHVVDDVVDVMVPGTVLEAEEADAADFSLRPISEVPDIAAVAALPDLEFPAFQDVPAYEGPRGPAEVEVGQPAIAFAYEESAVTEHGSDPAKSAPEASLPAPSTPAEQAPDLAVPVVISVPLDPAAVPPLAPVKEVVHVPAVAIPDDEKGNPHGEPPAVGNPHGEPPGHADDDVDELPPVIDEPLEEQPAPETEPEVVIVDEPTANVVTPAPSIVEPVENVFTPPESVLPPATLPPIPPVPPPEYTPLPFVRETPTAE